MLNNVEYVDVYNTNNNIHVFVTHFSIFFVVINICGYYHITYGACALATLAYACCGVVCVVWWGAYVGLFFF